MLNFEEELKKFHPSLEIEQSADAIYNQDFTDIADIVIKSVTENETKPDLSNLDLKA
jgi:hypothetical protein